MLLRVGVAMALFAVVVNLSGRPGEPVAPEEARSEEAAAESTREEREQKNVYSSPGQGHAHVPSKLVTERRAIWSRSRPAPPRTS